MIHNMVGGGTGGGKLPAIYAIYPAGSVCTCTNGTKTFTAKDSTGFWLFAGLEIGTWTVTITDPLDPSKTKSKAVEITTAGQVVSVVLDYAVYYYNAGDEYTDITGGWSAKNIKKESSYVARNPTVSKGTDSITISQNSGNVYSGVLATGQTLDLSDISTLYLRCDISCTGASNSYGTATFLAYTNANLTIQGNAEAYSSSDAVYGGSSETDVILTLDVSAITSAYIAVGVNNTHDNIKTTEVIKEVWGE